MNGPAKLEKGGLALIINAFRATENIGREVLLVEYVPPGATFPYRNWQVVGGNEGTWIVEAEGLVSVGMIAGEVEMALGNCCMCDPRHLMPLRDKDKDQHKVKGRVFMEKMK